MAGYSRRALLGASTATLGGLAGCSAVRDLITGPRAGAERTTDATTTRASTATTTATDRAAVYPRRVLVTNETDAETYVTVAVTRGDETVYGETRRVPPNSEEVAFEDVVASVGTYTVAIESTTGHRASQRWPVSPALSDLSVALRPDGVDFSQTAFCDPTCPPVSQGGETTDLPYYGDSDDNPLYYGAALSVVNDSGGTRDVRVVIARDGERLLDFRYRVPDGMSLDFPGMHVADVYDVRVVTDVGTGRHDWHLTKERYLTATITNTGVDIGCGGATASFLLVNEHHDPHQVTVRARPPASADSNEVLFRSSYVVQPGESTRVTDVFTGSGHYRLEVSLATGEETTYDWWLCGPRGPTEIRIGEDGSLSVIQLIPAE